MKLQAKLKSNVRKLKKEVVTISLAFKDKRTPFMAKVIIGLTISYALSPIDLIPDFIPILGYLDDLIILPLLVILSIKLIPKQVLTECRERANAENTVSKKLGIFSVVFIILIWLTVLGLIILKLVNK